MQNIYSVNGGINTSFENANMTGQHLNAELPDYGNEVTAA